MAMSLFHTSAVGAATTPNPTLSVMILLLRCCHLQDQLFSYAPAWLHGPMYGLPGVDPLKHFIFVRRLDNMGMHAGMPGA